MVPGIGKEVTYAPMSAASIVQISDDEEDEKQIHRVASPSTAKWPLQRKLEAITCSAEKQTKTRLWKSNAPQQGNLWEMSKKMLIALSNSNLCMKSICALYRKHKSMGVWKNGSNKCKVFLPLCKRKIVRLHVDELFEIYDKNMDPLFQP